MQSYMRYGNPMRCSVFIATSLDGYIARDDGAIDWLTEVQTIDGMDYGFAEFLRTADALVMGRGTYDVVRHFDPWPYGKIPPVVALSHGTLEIPPPLSATVEQMSGSPRQIADALERRGAKHLYIDGGQTIQRFLADDLIDRMIITRLPRLLGSGIPLFGHLDHDIVLRHVRTEAYSNGLVQSEYERNRTTRR